MDTAGTPVFIAFRADGVIISGCEAVPISQIITNDEASQQARCSTTALSIGVHVITATFAGTAFNFPAITSVSATPTQALTHFIIAVGAPPPVITVVVPPPTLPPSTTPPPNAPVSLPPITLTLRPVAAPSSTAQSPSNPAAANGSVSPNGVGWSQWCRWRVRNYLK